MCRGRSFRDLCGNRYCQAGDTGMVEKSIEIDRDTELFLDQRQRAHGPRGVTADLEEVVMAADSGRFGDLGKDTREPWFVVAGR